MDGVDARLAGAVTNEEAHKALGDALNEWLPGPKRDWTTTEGAVQAECCLKAWRLLDGPSAGWIGVGVLMLPAGFYWRVIVNDDGATATVQSPKGTASTAAWRYEEADAKRPDCALVLAARRALSGDKQWLN